MFAIMKGSMFVGVHTGSTLLGPQTRAKLFTTQPEAELFMSENGLTYADGYFTVRGYCIVRHPEDPQQYLHGTTDLRSTAVWSANRGAAMQFPSEADARALMGRLRFTTEAERAINSSATYLVIFP